MIDDDRPKCPTCGTPGVKVVEVELFDCGLVRDKGITIFPCKFYGESESEPVEEVTDK